MVSFNAAAGRTTVSGSEDFNVGQNNFTESSDPGLHCAFHSQVHGELTEVSSTHYPADIQQCALFDSDEDNPRRIGTEFVVTEKVFSMLPEDEKLLWHAHNVEVQHGLLEGLLSSPGTQEVANTYGRLVPSLQTNSENALPPALSQLLTSSSDLDLEKRRLSFAEDEGKPSNSTQGSEEGARPGEEPAKGAEDNTPYLLEFDIGKEDEYLNDAVNRPVVHHRSSHLPALTERMPNDGQFLSETLSTKF